MRLLKKIWRRGFALGCLVMLAALFSAQQAFADGPTPAAGSLENHLYLPEIFNMESAAWLGPDGGSLVCMVTDPRSSNTVYAGSWGGGVYKTNNGGASWFAAGAGIEAMALDSLTMDPANSQILFAGTHGYGVYKTTDGGASWYAVNNGIAENSVVYSLAVNPGNQGLIYAGTRIQGTLDGVLYKSENSGASWNAVFSQSSDWVYSLAINPNAPNQILAATHEHGLYEATRYGGNGDWGARYLTGGEPLKGRAVIFDPRAQVGNAYYSAWHGDFYRSTDLGKHWNLSNNGLGDSHIYPNGITIEPDAQDTLYAATNTSSVGGVLRSSNDGLSWSGSGLSGLAVYNVAALRGNSTLLAGTYMHGIYRSDNGGANWYTSQAGFVNSQVTGLVFPGGSTVYASTEGGGVARSTNGGMSWSDFNANLNDVYVNGLVLHPSNPNILFALTSSAGLLRIDLSSGGGWSAAGVQNNPTQAALAGGRLESRSPFARYDALDDLGEMDSALAGSDAAQTAAPASINGSINVMQFAPSNPNIAYVGTNGSGIYWSSNGGTNWSAGGLGGVILSLAVSPTTPAKVFAVTNATGGIKASADGGKNWVTVTLTGPPENQNLAIYAVTISAADPESVYVGTANGVWRLRGSAWAAVGLQGRTVNVLAANPSIPGMLIAGTNGGAFSTFTGAAVSELAWFGIAPELASVPVQSINFNRADGRHIYFGTTTRGTLRVVFSH